MGKELAFLATHGDEAHYARYSDEELRQIIEWLPGDPDVQAYVLFNNIPRVADIKRFEELIAEKNDQPLRSSLT